MIGRLWYPQLDAYDAIRRMGCLLSRDVSKRVSQERLYICDFYLANPPLLHKTHMSMSHRKDFNSLSVPRPEKSFLVYPSPPLLFQKMAEVQREAFRTLTGKGLIDLGGLNNGEVKPSDEGKHVFVERFATLFSEREALLASFLIAIFWDDSIDIGLIRHNTGLRRPT